MRWKHFTEEELASPDNGECLMDENFMQRLQFLRIAFDRPMIITSGYRSPEHNKKVGGKPTSAHLQGRAVDVLVAGAAATELVFLARERGFTGFGLKQHGPWETRFVHLDDTTGELRPRIWTYYK